MKDLPMSENQTQKTLEEFISKYKETINGSFCFFGSWFGKPLDNWHQLVSYETQDNYILMRFNEEETLEVWKPKGLSFDGYFMIQDATRVRWEWFYYGRPRLPENRFYIEHLQKGVYH